MLKDLKELDVGSAFLKMTFLGLVRSLCLITFLFKIREGPNMDIDKLTHCATMSQPYLVTQAPC